MCHIHDYFYFSFVWKKFQRLLLFNQFLFMASFWEFQEQPGSSKVSPSRYLRYIQLKELLWYCIFSVQEDSYLQEAFELILCVETPFVSCTSFMFISVFGNQYSGGSEGPCHPTLPWAQMIQVPAHLQPRKKANKQIWPEGFSKQHFPLVLKLYEMQNLF